MTEAGTSDRKDAHLANWRDAYLCFCEQVTADEFRARIQTAPDASFDAVCAELGIASKCTACLLNAETIFIETARPDSGRAGAAPARKTAKAASAKQQVYRLIDAVFPKVARVVPGIIPVIAGKDIVTTVSFANTIPPVIGSRAPAFQVRVETHDAEGKVVYRDGGTVQPGGRLEFEICKGLKTSTESDELVTGACFLTYKALQDGYIGCIRPHFKVITPISTTAVHSAGAGDCDAFMEVCFMNPNERQYVSAVNCTDKPATVTMAVLVEGERREAGAWTLPPRGARLLPVPADMAPPGRVVGVNALSDRDVRWHYMVVSGTPPRISLDHI